jgi:hypothetical protein
VFANALGLNVAAPKPRDSKEAVFKNVTRVPPIVPPRSKKNKLKIKRCCKLSVEKRPHCGVSGRILKPNFFCSGTYKFRPSLFAELVKMFNYLNDPANVFIV